MLKVLYLFTHDLRVHDNPALVRASQSEELTCLFCVEQKWFQHGQQQLKSMGPLRWQFLQGCLSGLNTRLNDLGQNLFIAYGNTVNIIGRYLEATGADTLIVSRQFGFYERNTVNAIATQYPNISIALVDTFTLFDEQQSPLLSSQLPKQYTPFKKAVDEHLNVPSLITKPNELPSNSLKQSPATLVRPDWLPLPVKNSSPYEGDEDTAQSLFDAYIKIKLPSSYASTRNDLYGENFSSKLSAWLSTGVLSVRWVAHQLFKYEATHGADLSCRTLWHELLWREYFQWLAVKINHKLFRFQGISKRKLLTSFYPQRFKSWCEGTSPYPLVNACMKELNHTGYISNRGRQIVASCLVNELACDWRYGAAWFEYKLVDYDVAINWGNWQYIAGVGADPRGGRHFNLEKQTQQFDQDRSYRRRWLGDIPSNVQTLDQVDAADWPASN